MRRSIVALGLLIVLVAGAVAPAGGATGASSGSPWVDAVGGPSQAAPAVGPNAAGSDVVGPDAAGLDVAGSNLAETVVDRNGTAGDQTDGTSSPQIVALYPDPYADGDRGEYVVVRFPERTNASGWTLVDDDGHVAALPDGPISGRVVLTTDPDAVDAEDGLPAVTVDGQVRLANAGDSISLRRPGGSVASSGTYDRATEGEVYRRTGDGWRWTPPGATSFDPVETGAASATAFVLPDAPGVVVDELRDADRRILLAGYTLTSGRVVDVLLDAHERDVEVRVLLEGSPVGGVSERQVEALDRLTAAGVPVTVLAGRDAPYRFHHAKYAVIDDRALVLTENFKPAGTGGRSSRGWGVVIHDGEMAGSLAALFRTDDAGRGAVAWSEHRTTVDPVSGFPSRDTFPAHFAPEQVPVESARLLVAPDNARPELEATLRAANDSIRIQQMSIEGLDDPLLQASIAAARNGTDVEILLSSASYVEGENRDLVTRLDRLAERERLPISADLVDPRGRFEKVHAKVAVVDGRHVVLGSLNWNPTAYGENREVVVVLTGERVADYYEAVFDADARDAPLWRVPAGLVAVVCLAWVALGVLAAARIRWAA